MGSGLAMMPTTVATKIASSRHARGSTVAGRGNAQMRMPTPTTNASCPGRAPDGWRWWRRLTAHSTSPLTSTPLGHTAFSHSAKDRSGGVAECAQAFRTGRVSGSRARVSSAARPRPDEEIRCRADPARRSRTSRSSSPARACSRDRPAARQRSRGWARATRRRDRTPRKRAPCPRPDRARRQTRPTAGSERIASGRAAAASPIESWHNRQARPLTRPAHDPQMPLRHVRLKASVGSMRSAIVNSASSSVCLSVHARRCRSARYGSGPASAIEPLHVRSVWLPSARSAGRARARSRYSEVQ